MMSTGKYAQKNPVPQSTHGFLETVPGSAYDIAEGKSWFQTKTGALVRFDLPVARRYDIFCSRVTKLDDYSFKKALLLFENALVHNKFDPVNIGSKVELPSTRPLESSLAAKSEKKKLPEKEPEEQKLPEKGSPTEQKPVSPTKGTSSSEKKPDDPEKRTEVKESKLDVWVTNVQ